MKSFGRSVPFVEAFQLTECGLSCVCMILRYYKRHITMPELREYLETGRDGSTLKDLNGLMQKFKLATKIYKCNTEGLRQIQLPAIIYCENKHFVVLERMNNKNAHIVDPVYGKCKLEIKDLNEIFSGFAISCYPNSEFATQKSDHTTWKYFISIIFNKKSLFIKIILLSLVTYLLTLGMPVFIQNLIDNVINGRNVKSISHYFVILGMFSLVYIVFYYFKGSNLVRLKVDVDKAISTNLFSYLLKVPYKFFDVRNKYDLVYSLSSSAVVRETFANQMINGIIDIGAVCFIIIYMFNQSALLASISVMLFIINLMMAFLIQRYVTQYNKYLISKQSEVQSVQVEAVFSILGIKMSAIEDDIYADWYKKYEVYLKKFYNKEKINNFLYTLVSFIRVISPLVILSISTYLVIQSYMSTGQMIAFFSLSSTFFSLSDSVFNTWVSFINCNLYLERLSDIILTKTENESQNLIKNNVEGNIKAENISFSYTNRSKKVINNISLNIKSGDKVAIVGKSGCGKSTLAKLLVGLYNPTEGNIFYDGTNLNELDTKFLRRQLGIVPQDIMLFNKSIFENITMNRDGVTLQEVEKACNIARISDDINSLPMGYDTIISEMGMNFSGGQRQRIALARAIINEPKVLILDEATSSLDNVNEKTVTDYLKHIGCTRIIIAHRLSTIIDSDVIFVLNDGQLVEQGTHLQLINSNGEYSKLYRASTEN